MIDQRALERMPHKGAMLLIDRIILMTEIQIQCIGTPHATAAYPLRVEGILYPASLVELGAQAAAAHAGAQTIKGAHEGLLVGLQNIQIHSRKPVVGVGHFTVSADQVYLDDSGMIYQFTVSLGDETLISGRVVLKIRDSGKSQSRET